MFDNWEILPEEILNKNGTPMRGVCLVKVDSEYYKVKHSFEEVMKLIQPIVIKGYIK